MSSPRGALLGLMLALTACGSTSAGSGETMRDASREDAAGSDGAGPDSGSAFSCPDRSEAFPWPDRFVEVEPEGLPRLRMRYVDAGSGTDVFVLLHGIPTSAVRG